MTYTDERLKERAVELAKEACPNDLSGGPDLPDTWKCSPTQLEIRVGYMRATLDRLRDDAKSLRHMLAYRHAMVLIDAGEEAIAEVDEFIHHLQTLLGDTGDKK